MVEKAMAVAEYDEALKALAMEEALAAAKGRELAVRQLAVSRKLDRARQRAEEREGYLTLLQMESSQVGEALSEFARRRAALERGRAEAAQSARAAANDRLQAEAGVGVLTPAVGDNHVQPGPPSRRRRTSTVNGAAVEPPRPA